MKPLGPIRNNLLAAGLASALLLLEANPGFGQLATISFPDTVVGQSSTVKCPTASVSICFGANCSGSGTVQSVSGPNPPFSIGKFNLLNNSQFFGGNCEANPVSLPVPVGANQILAYQATFSPSAEGLFAGSLTFSTPGGPATVNLTGKGLPAPDPRADKGAIGIQFNSESYVPGDLLGLSYRTIPGTLQGPVDLYFAVVLPGGQLLFLTSGGAFVPGFEPFRRNVTVADETTTLFNLLFPVDLQFGTYTCYMAMVYAGADATDSRNWASAVSSATVSYMPLSPAQVSIIQSRGGNPDLLAATWVDELLQKRELWLYLSDSPTTYSFLNGELQSQSPASGAAGGATPKVDPSLFSPQTTLDKLTAAFGPPTSVAPLNGAPDLQTVSYSVGLKVILRAGRFSAAATFIP